MSPQKTTCAEGNALLMRESLTFAFSLDHVVDHPWSAAGSPTRPPERGGVLGAMAWCCVAWAGAEDCRRAR